MRGAVALAPTLQEELDDLWADEPAPLHVTPTGLYRLLGYGDQYAPPLQVVYDYPQPQYVELPLAEPLYTQAAYYPYSEAYVGPRAVERPLRRGLPGWVAAAGVALLALVVVAVVTAPVMVLRNGRGLGLSSYRELPIGAVSDVTVMGAPVVDATSGQSGAPAPAEAQAPQPAAQAPAASPYAVVGPPTVSVGQIERVLAQYGSPAAGLGQKLYDLGVKYGINPAFALAFFVHESGCGTKGVARFTKSLGNIRWTPGFDNYEGYRNYSSWEAGMDDWYALIRDQYVAQWGLSTVDAIIPVYAPSADRNDPPTYIASVKQLVDAWRGK